MNKYEAMYIIDATLEEQVRKDVIERFSNVVTNNGGTVDMLDEMGKRRLAYSINYKTDGYYVLMYITAPSDLPLELERNFQITESILRYLVVKSDGVLPVKRERFAPAMHVAPVVTPVAAPVVEPAPEAEPITEPVAEPVIELAVSTEEVSTQE